MNTTPLPYTPIEGQVQWRMVVDHADYEVSDSGLIRKIADQHLMKISLRNDGRYIVSMRCSGIRSTRTLYRVVAMAFCVPERPEQNEVDHINRDFADDRAVNLRWVTRHENMKNRVNAPSRASSTRVDVLEVESGSTVVYDSLIKAAIATKMTKYQVSDRCLGKVANSGPFHFKYHVPAVSSDTAELWKSFIANNGKMILVSNLGRYDLGRGYIDSGTPSASSDDSYLSGPTYSGFNYMHTLVATVWVPNTNPNRTQVNHINGDKRCNHASNLEWTTRRENMQHAHDTGLNKSKRSVSKISVETGEVLETFSSVASAAKDVSVSASSISCVITDSGRKKHKTAGGFGWRYAAAMP